MPTFPPIARAALARLRRLPPHLTIPLCVLFCVLLAAGGKAILRSTDRPYPQPHPAAAAPAALTPPPASVAAPAPAPAAAPAAPASAASVAPPQPTEQIPPPAGIAPGLAALVRTAQDDFGRPVTLSRSVVNSPSASFSTGESPQIGRTSTWSFWFYQAEPAHVVEVFSTGGRATIGVRIDHAEVVPESERLHSARPTTARAVFTVPPGWHRASVVVAQPKSRDGESVQVEVGTGDGETSSAPVPFFVPSDPASTSSVQAPAPAGTVSPTPPPAAATQEAAA